MNLLPKDINLETGLTDEEALRRYTEQGPNSLPEGKKQSALSIFISQLKSPLVYILVIAGLVTLFLKDYPDSVVIFLAVLVNTVFGFVQEQKAGKALEALKRLVHPHARVIRGGEIKTIVVEKLVVGDVVLLSQGDKVPADGVVFDVSRFYTSEAILTGESVSVEKKKEDNVYMGTVVSAGTAKMLVLVTGKETEMGKIASSVSKINQDTPLRGQLKKFSKQLSLLVIGLTTVVFVIGLILGESPVEIFTTSVALAVSAIPEGLLVALTVILAIGMQRILSRKGLVRDLVSAETLGGVTTICVDKTGTLTQGKMQVVDVIGDGASIALQATVANDIDDPMLIAAWEWGSGKILDVKLEERNHVRLDSIPFTSDQRFFASLNRWDQEQNVIFVNGSPEVLLERSGIDEGTRVEIHSRIDSLTKEGKRLIGLARKYVPSSVAEVTLEDVKEGLSWIGLLAFTDPVRDDVKESLKLARDAGIRLIVITGDYSNTAMAVLDQLDLKVDPNDVILGSYLEDIREEELKSKLSTLDVMLFARTKPDQKLKIVEILKGMGEVVAMMGDGVNDAPALSQADIGIVVDEASDVAKESADLVLLDSRFSTIVAAVEEGRGIFDNIRKVILYLMCDAFEEIFVVLVSLLFRLPLPISAAQVLWVNLVSDGFPGLALTVDPKALGTMRRKPKSPKENLVAPWMYKLMIIVSFIGGASAFILFYYMVKTTGNIILARSVAFAAIGINSLVYVFSVKTLQDPFWKSNPLKNRWLIGAVLGGVLLQVLPFIWGGLGNFLKVEPLGRYWILVFASSFVMFLAIEVSKWGFRHQLKHNGSHR
ncbi:MAG: HAD-IC family P-type ATPase [Patescibacteria group bacterium]|jgi:Ca2+-transporting ATPase